MAATTKWYLKGIQKALTGTIDLDTDSFKVMLLTSAYTPDQDLHDFRNDVEAAEVSSANYTAGGTAVTLGVSTDAVTNEIRVTVSDAAWTNVTFTARYAVIYKARGGASSADELLAYVDFGVNETVSGGNFTVDFDTTASLKITAT